MNDKEEPPHPTESEPEKAIDVQRRAIRAAVRKRLRGGVISKKSANIARPSRHRMCYSSGNLTPDLAFNPLIYPRKK